MSCGRCARTTRVIECVPREHFEWRPPPYEYEYVKPPIDVLYGSAQLREGLQSGTSAGELTRSWEAGVRKFAPIREKALLY